MIAALSSESVETARSRGLPSRVVIGKHALRHALIPPLTIAGLTTGYLISGAVIVEYAFGLGGLGSLLVTTVESKDFALVQGIGLVMVLWFLLVNLAVDLLYLAVDPRIRLRHRATE
jgi:peptide/nickel transport system permease protein